MTTRIQSALLVTIGLLLLTAAPVQADMIHLKNGSVIEGYFLNQEEDYFIFRTFDGEKKIRASEIQKMEMGYSGIPFCLKESGENEFCEGLLHGISESGLVYVDKPEKNKKKSISLENIDYITFRKSSAGQFILPMLGTGVLLETGKDDNLIKGRITEIAEDKITVTDSVRGEVILGEDDLREGKIYRYIHPVDRPFQIRRGIGPGTFIPGLYQFQRKDYLRGSLILGGLLFSGAAAGYEMQQANLIDDRAMTDPLFLLYDNPVYRKEFQAKQMNQAGLGLLMAGIYFYHLFDAGLPLMLFGEEQPETQVKDSSVYFGVNPCLTATRNIYTGDREQYCEIRVGFRF